ncbi:hypothetical protein BH23ACT11_BH23ACT11_28750 [soil metagenome]
MIRVSLDKTVETEDISWKVQEARLTNKLSSYAFPPKTKSGVFIQIIFTVENTSDLPVTLGEESVSLLKDGTESPAGADVNSQFVKPDLNILFNEKSLIEPGQSKAGQANFDLDVPFEAESMEEATGFEAVFKDPDPTTFDDKKLKLEF